MPTLNLRRSPRAAALLADIDNWRYQHGGKLPCKADVITAQFGQTRANHYRIIDRLIAAGYVRDLGRHNRCSLELTVSGLEALDTLAYWTHEVRKS